MKPSTASSSPSRKRKIILWIIGLVVFYAVTGFLILPPIVRSVAAKQISKQLDREVSIQQVQINPFVLSTTIRGLLIKDKDGQPFVSWDEVYVNFQLSSFFGRAWVFKEISTTRPFVRAQMNKDGTFNFSDLIAKFSTNAAPAQSGPSKPLVLHVDRLRIRGATAAIADFTPREPFKRTLGPLDITLDNFRTDPDNKNPYSFAGTTDAGEQIAWSGFFYLDPLRSEGELRLYNFSLNKYAPLYQDLVRFEIRDGTIALDTKYRLQLTPTNRVVAVDDSAFALRNFKLGAPGETNNLAELPLFVVTGASADLVHHRAAVDSVTVADGSLSLSRDKNSAINVVELSKPSQPDAVAPGGILFLLRSVTNAVALLLNSTNQWSGTVRSVDVTNCALHLEDHVNSRPARLDLTEIALAAKNISNLPGTNLTADLSLRWNTNGTIKIGTTASFLPPTADVQIDLDQLDLGTLDPYLEPKVDLYILGSKVGLHGTVSLRTPQDQLPLVAFKGDASLTDFHTVDGVMAKDLVKWDAIRFQGIEANLNPQSVAIKEIDVVNAYARLVVETNKSINLLNALRMTKTNAPAPTNEASVATVAKAPGSTINEPVATNSALPLIAIGAIVITNTAVSFSDRSIRPEVDLAIQDINGSIAGLSSEQLQHADINLTAMVEGVGPASVTGHINPFSDKLTNSVKISVKDIDLTPTSPYAGKFAGYGIAEGKLDLDLDYQMVGKKLNSKNVITLDQFTFGDHVDSPDATHLPVRLAIAILKDRDGKIVLDVPIQGSLDDPKFRVGKVVERAIVNILEKVATSPFSLLGALFGGGGEELGYQDFAAGSATLTAADQKKLDSLEKGLYARPGLKLEIAGGVDPVGDRQGLQRAALDRDIRTRIWLNLRKTEQATNSVDQIVLSPGDRDTWIKTIYAEAEANGKITPELIAADTNLAAYAADVLPQRQQTDAAQKGATQLVNSAQTQTANQAAAAGYKTSLVPPPDPMEAILLATYPISASDLATLAANRATAVQTYLLKSGKVEASRIFIKQAENVRSDGSRAWLQFR
jgi:hypothetical protein